MKIDAAVLPRSARALVPSLALVVALAGCMGAGTATQVTSTGSSTPSGSLPASPSGAGSGGAVPLAVGLGYIPSVQFAQFYRAEEAGYYRDAGLTVTFDHRIDPELVTLLGQGSVDVAISDGTSLIPAVSQGIPVRYVATIYARFPNVVVAKQASGIATAADLRGRRLGTPGKFGSGWIMLQALVSSAGMTTDDLDVQLYPDFGQSAALQQGAVDAATGFANNEPIQLERAGVPVNVLRVDDVVALPGPGLVVGTAGLESKREALRSFVSATLRAMEEIAEDPEVGLDAALTRIPELADDRDGQLAILEATVGMWQSPLTESEGFGAIDRDGWAQSVDFMRGLPDSPVANPVTVDQLVTEELLGGT